MTRRSTIILRALFALIGAGVLAFLLGEPHFEGRNAHATLFEIYFRDPFLAYVYLGSIPFFVGLYQAFRTLDCVGRKETAAAAKALRTIKRCGIALVGFAAGGAVLILMFGDKEDRPPGIFMSALAISASSVIAGSAAAFERIVKKSA